MTDLSPLNGTETHPLSDYAKDTLREVSLRPIPSQEFNPGAVNRLLRNGLVELVELTSPYKTVKRKVAHLKITDAGRSFIEGDAWS